MRPRRRPVDNDRFPLKRPHPSRRYEPYPRRRRPVDGGSRRAGVDPTEVAGTGTSARPPTVQVFGRDLIGAWNSADPDTSCIVIGVETKMTGFVGGHDGNGRRYAVGRHLFVPISRVASSPGQATEGTGSADGSDLTSSTSVEREHVRGLRRTFCDAAIVSAAVDWFAGSAWDRRSYTRRPR